MEFNIRSNIKVSVNAFTCSETYLSILSTSIPGYTNELLVRQLTVPRDWGNRKLLILRPSDEQMESELPQYSYIVWLNSDYKINSEGDGSEMVVAFFAESPIDSDLKFIFQSHLETINWEDNAVSFNI